jgi:phosphoglycerate kinase
MESRMGSLFRSEIKFLNGSFWSGKDRVCIIGGSKVADKCRHLCQMVKKGRADKILATGKVSCLILNRQGYDVNQSYVSEISQDMISQLDYVMEKNEELIDFPIDVAVDNNGRKNLKIEDIKTHNSIFDIGYRTADKYGKIIRDSSSVTIAEPAGYYERENFSFGTSEILNIASRQDSSMLDGGDTLAASNLLDILVSIM